MIKLEEAIRRMNSNEKFYYIEDLTLIRSSFSHMKSIRFDDKHKYIEGTHSCYDLKDCYLSLSAALRAYKQAAKENP